MELKLALPVSKSLISFFLLLKSRRLGSVAAAIANTMRPRLLEGIHGIEMLPLASGFPSLPCESMMARPAQEMQSNVTLGIKPKNYLPRFLSFKNHLTYHFITPLPCK